MKKILIISIILNLIFVSVLGYFWIKRNDASNLKSNEIKLPEPDKPYWYYKNYQHWEETKSLYEILPNDSNEIIFVGNSLTLACPWAELFSDPRIKNRGIGGDNTEGVLERLDEITASKPDKIFIDLGTNDLALDMRIPEISNNYEKILDRIGDASPHTKIYVQSVLPTSGHPDRNNDSIRELNKNLEHLAIQKSATYINLFDSFTATDGNLNMNYSLDGLHLTGKGYLIWRDILRTHVQN
jgi:lysophospholipase L1-like esterase